ncbi:MAG TPA: rRNA maturation RNase YbeY [Acidobacteriaceae bacterium]|jgi:probable rRNA maturation factor|nr:rRNA maturation RNase YbeY [Acidobacteriaceae bacterium]
MILVEPAMRAQYGRSDFTKKDLETFLAQARRAVGLAGSVSVLLTGDAEIQRLNREFRGKNKPTDVLSFPSGENAGRARTAGDLALSVETAEREAQRLGHSLNLELKVLLLHGTLHLAGYDHEADSGEMARKEEALRRKLGLAQGLIARTAQGANGGRRGRKP